MSSEHLFSLYIDFTDFVAMQLFFDPTVIINCGFKCFECLVLWQVWICWRKRNLSSHSSKNHYGKHLSIAFIAKVCHWMKTPEWTSDYGLCCTITKLMCNYCVLELHNCMLLPSVNNCYWCEADVLKQKKKRRRRRRRRRMNPVLYTLMRIKTHYLSWYIFGQISYHLEFPWIFQYLLGLISDLLFQTDTKIQTNIHMFFFFLTITWSHTL